MTHLIADGHTPPEAMRLVVREYTLRRAVDEQDVIDAEHHLD